jgi:hypothetical protein
MVERRKTRTLHKNREGCGTREQRPWMKRWKAELVQLVADILFDILERVE